MIKVINKNKLIPVLLSLILAVSSTVVSNANPTLKRYEKNPVSTISTIITPNDFQGTDIERIRAAIAAARETTEEIIIPRDNANGTNVWKIDSAILLPSNMTVILDNCVIQLSDSSRDNLFRSDNVGIGTKRIEWNKNIRIIGMGHVVLKGADNPRATGDGHRTLVNVPEKGRVSYGSDAGKAGRKQMGDWRNIMILMAFVKGFEIKNVTIKNSHAWALSFERVLNAKISDITFNLPLKQMVNGHKVEIHNRDGIDLRQGCKYFMINNINGFTEDDFIALTSLGIYNPHHKIGELKNSTMVTAPGWRGPQDDIADITITDINCKTFTRAIAIRASGSAGIHDVFINGVIAKPRYNTLLVGNKNYGKPSLPGKINKIYAMNLMGNGRALVRIKSPIANCVFMNGIYTGDAPSAIQYDLDKEKTTNMKTVNIVKISLETR